MQEVCIYMKRVHKIRSPIFFHIENTFISNECYINERLDFQIFFNVIYVAINALLHALWHFSYTVVTELSCHVANHTLTDFRHPSHILRIVTCWSSSISCSCSIFATVSAETEGRPELFSSWMSVQPYMNFLTHFLMFLMSTHVVHRLHITENECQWG